MVAPHTFRVEAFPVVCVQLEMIGRTPSKRRLRSQDAVVTFAAICRQRFGMDVVPVEIAAKSEDEAQAIGQRCGTFSIKRAADLIEPA